jgi:UDP-glucose 4-epimerase
MLGEASRGRPANLGPLLCRIAAGELPDLSIFGSDWPTHDGTGIRDYLHVQDLAEGHVAALRYLAKAYGASTLNLGAGRGHSVLEVIAAFEKACGRRLTKTMAPRRPGDVAAYYADPSRAEKLLNWRTTRGLDAICADAWRWQKNGGRY